MADIFLLFLGFLAVLAAASALAVIIIRGRRRLRELRSPQAIRKRVDDYLRSVDQAATEDELDRLDRERKL